MENDQTSTGYQFPNCYMLILVGIPASGKSFFAKQIKNHIESNSDEKRKIVIVDTDIIRAEMYGDFFNPDNEKKVIEEKYNKIQSLLSDPLIFLIIVDDLNYLTSQRKELHSIAFQSDFIPFTIYFDCNLETAITRNQKRKGKEKTNGTHNNKEVCQTRLPDEVITRVFDKIDPPGKKYVWDQPDYILECNELDFSNHFKQIISLLTEKTKINDIIEENKPDSHSISHYIDIISRKVLNELITFNRENLPGNDISDLDGTQIDQPLINLVASTAPDELNKIRKDFVKYQEDLILKEKHQNKKDSNDSVKFENAIRKNMFAYFADMLLR